MGGSPTGSLVRFGLFELDLRTKQLSKNGTKIRLPQQPLQLLSLLLERPGEVLTREELRRQLWPSDVFVDFDHGLNKSIQKLRDALGDSADSPRFIETIPRVGYRFIAPVNGGTGPPELETDTRTAQLQDFPTAPPAAAIVASRRVRWFLPAACIAVLALTVGWFIHRRLRATEPIRSLAVLPLDNLSGDPSQEYFAEGMTDELITMLARDSTLRITSRTSVMQYKGAHRPLAEIAGALHVDGILEGSVSRSRNQVHVTLQLIRADTDTHLWAESYDREDTGVAALPDEAAQAIASRLNSSSVPHAAARYVSPEAHDAYLHGHYLWTVDRNEEAGEYFKRAVEIQPDYALGWAGVSQYYGAGAYDGQLNPIDALPQAEAAGRKAVQLDDSLPQAHLVLSAAIFFNDWDGESALRQISRATELDPKFAEAIHMHALILSALGRYEEAVAVQRQGTAVDPLEHPAAMAEILLFSRQYDQALDDASLRLQDFPLAPDLLSTLAATYHWKGMDRQSAEMLARLYAHRGSTQPNQEVLNAFASGGYRQVVLWRLAELERTAKARYVSGVRLAHFHAQLGERDKTLALLDRAFHERDPGLLFIRTDPAYDFLYGDPHYAALVQKIGLPPAY